jgi:dTMP kinase
MFISFEGSEGCGKTSQVKRLVDFLSQRGQAVLTIREPGGTAIGEQIRSILLNPENVDMEQRTEILLFQASRAQLVEKVIRPRLAQGGVVICDRYADSTLAYQGYGYQRDLAAIRHSAIICSKKACFLFISLIKRSKSLQSHKVTSIFICLR